LFLAVYLIVPPPLRGTEHVGIRLTDFIVDVFVARYRLLFAGLSTKQTTSRRSFYTNWSGQRTFCSTLYNRPKQQNTAARRWT